MKVCSNESVRKQIDRIYPMNHLHPQIQHLLNCTDEERIEHILSDHWIGYSRAKTILEKMESLFTRPRVKRMPGLLIVGGTNNGKSTLLRRFCAKHPSVDNPGTDQARVPVLNVQCPPGPDERRFYHAILDALNAPYRPSSRVEEKHRQIKTILEGVGTRLLILDELHNTLAGPSTRQRYFLNVLKYLSNDLCLPIVAAGTDKAFNVMTTDEQISNRLQPMFLPRWHDGKEFWALLASFESGLPLKIPSNLKEESLATEIFFLSDGIIGEAASLLKEAACKAITTGKESITLKIIRSLNFVRPSKRRKTTGDDAVEGEIPEDE